MIVAALLLAPLLGAALGRLLPGRGGEVGQLLAATLTLALALAAGAQVVAAGPIAWGPLYLDPLGALLAAVVALVSWAASAYAIGYIRHDVAERRLSARQPPWFYLWFHLFVFTMLGVVTTDNLGLMWAAIEATTLASAVLVGFYRTREALEAAWKYLVICTVGISFALFGVLLLYAAGARVLGPGDAALSWRLLTEEAARLDPGLVRLGLLFVVLGYGTKAGFAPLHTWLPDAHSQAPTPVSAVLSGVLLPCALYGIMRTHAIAVGALGPAYPSSLLIGFGVLSAAVAVPFVLIQHDVKRLLAYSSIEHVGIIAAAIGIGGPVALFGGLLHLVVHALGKALLFFAAGSLAHRYGSRNMARIAGAARVLPFTGPAFLAGGLAIAGAPPFGLFVSEFSIFSAGFGRGYALVSAALIASVTLVFAGVVFHFGRMVLGEPRGGVARGEAGLSSVFLGVPLAALLALGLWVPPPLASALGQAARALGSAP
ncbi:MAG TPA: hydrogenase 4 subunit F [Chloroflexota bacterium]